MATHEILVKELHDLALCYVPNTIRIDRVEICQGMIRGAVCGLVHKCFGVYIWLREIHGLQKLFITSLISITA